jgi:DNA-binding NtrC family response regulator
MLVARRGRLLCIGADPLLVQCVQRIAPRLALDAAHFAATSAARPAWFRKRWDVVVLDGASTAADQWPLLLDELRTHDPRLPIIVWLDAATAGTVMAAAGRGACACLSSTTTSDQRLHDVLRQAREARDLLLLPVQPAGDSRDQADLLGQSPAMLDFCHSLGYCRAGQGPLLLFGEPGTGKDHAAHYYLRSLVPTATRIESLSCREATMDELRSAIGDRGPSDTSGTNCDARQDAAVWVLKEAEFLPQALQTALTENAACDSRSASAVTRQVLITREHPRRLWQSGIWRGDFVLSLAPRSLRVPTLRERGSEDILLLAAHFVSRLLGIARGFGRPGEIPRMTPGARQLLTEYAWPGNLTELRCVLARAAAQPLAVLDESAIRRCLLDTAPSGRHAPPSDSPTVTTTTATDLSPTPDWNAAPTWARFVDEQLARSPQSLYATAVGAVERGLIAEVLRRTGGNRARAARILGMTRTSLRRKIAAAEPARTSDPVQPDAPRAQRAAPVDSQSPPSPEPPSLAGTSKPAATDV